MISLLQAVLTDRPSDNFSSLSINIRTNYKNKTTIYKGRQQTEHRQQILSCHLCKDPMVSTYQDTVVYLSLFITHDIGGVAQPAQARLCKKTCLLFK